MFRKRAVVNTGLLITLCGAGVFPGVGVAAAWTLSKGATFSTTYTDNSRLEDSGKESDFIATINPHVALKGSGARANVDFVGSFQIDSRSEGSDSLNPRLRLDADAELMRNLFFVDAHATATQNAIDPYARGGNDTLSRTDNVTTTYNYNISPYLVSRVKRYANIEARYTFDRVIHDSDQANNSNSQSALLSINSGPRFSKISWGVVGNYRETDYKDRSNSQLRSTDLSLGYRFNRAWMASASVGKEWNSFASTRSDDDGTRLDFRVKWTPSPRTTLDVGFGDRFFGSTPSLDFSHRRKKSVIKVSYSREVMDSRTLVARQDVYPINDLFGYVIDPITGDPAIVPRNLATLDDSTFVDERLNASFEVKGKRTTVTFKGDHSKQIYQDSQRDSKLYGFGVALKRKLSGTTDANIGVNWRGDDRGDGDEADTLTLTTGLSHKLGSKSSISVNYSHTERDSDRIDDDYEENRVIVSLDFRF